MNYVFNISKSLDNTFNAQTLIRAAQHAPKLALTSGKPIILVQISNKDSLKDIELKPDDLVQIVVPYQTTSIGERNYHTVIPQFAIDMLIQLITLVNKAELITKHDVVLASE